MPMNIIKMIIDNLKTPDDVKARWETMFMCAKDEHRRTCALLRLKTKKGKWCVQGKARKLLLRNCRDFERMAVKQKAPIPSNSLELNS